MNTFSHTWREKCETHDGMTTAIFEDLAAWKRNEVVYVDTCWQEDGHVEQCPRGYETAIVDNMSVHSGHMNRNWDAAQRYHQKLVKDLLNPPTTKRCRSCHQVKDLSEFGRHHGFRDQHQNHCKACLSMKAKARYARRKHEDHLGKDSRRR